MLRLAGAWGVERLMIGGLSAVAFLRVTEDLPTAEQLVAYQAPAATRVLAADGTLLGELYTERRYPVPLDRIPRHVRLAFLAAEDASFYGHHGIDPVSVARAAVVNLQRSGVSQGGSTITQQLVKMLLLSPERSWERKAKELYLALRLESATTKDEILRLYLNQSTSAAARTDPGRRPPLLRRRRRGPVDRAGRAAGGRRPGAGPLRSGPASL